MLSERDYYNKTNWLFWLILLDQTLWYLANFYSAELPTDCVVVIQHRSSFGPGFSLLYFCLDSLRHRERVTKVSFGRQLYTFVGMWFQAQNYSMLHWAWLKCMIKNISSNTPLTPNKNKTADANSARGVGVGLAQKSGK